MKTLKSIIFEKLIINRNIQPSQQDVDDLTGDNITLYSDRECDDEDMQDIQCDYCQNMLNKINNHKDNCGFICTKFKSLGQSKSIKGGYDPNNDIYFISDDLNEFIDKIITGKDSGYELRLVGGHIEVDCINSGSSATYYIYQLDKTAWEQMESWWRGDEEVDNVRFLYKEGSIIPIEIK